MNGISYINANLPASQSSMVGADNRPRWTANRINSNVSSNIVLGNQNEGSSWHASASMQKRFRQGFLKGAYSYGESKNTVDPGSIASGSWTDNQMSGDPNNPGVSYATNFPGHRVFLTGSYRLEYLKFGATTFSFFWQGYTNGVASYTYAGDLNGDGATANDLIYVPRDESEMNFAPITGSAPFSAAEQAAAWETYIRQDAYLSQHRGEYVVRNAVRLPMVNRFDFSVAQDLFRNLGSARHSLQFRADILNFGNLLEQRLGRRPAPDQRAAAHQPRRGRGRQADVPPARRQRRADDEVARDDGRAPRRLPGAVQPALQLQLGRQAARRAAHRWAGRDPSRPALFTRCPWPTRQETGLEHNQGRC